MELLYSKIQIETPVDLFDADDKDFEFTSLEGAVVRALQLSKEFNGITKVVFVKCYKNGDYSRRVIATINAKKLPKLKMIEYND